MVMASEPFKMPAERLLLRREKMFLAHAGQGVAAKGCPGALRQWPRRRSTVVLTKNRLRISSTGACTPPLVRGILLEKGRCIYSSVVFTKTGL